MQYDPIKKSVGRFFAGSHLMRRILYTLLDLLLLRTWHVRKALREISGHLPVEASVLDAGSGFGQYTWRMSRMYPGWRIRSTDIDSDHVKDCERFFKKAGLEGRVECKTSDLTTLSDKARFDLVLCVDVMEHIEEDKKVFMNFFNSLNNNGILLISTPSDQGGSDVHNDEEDSFIDEHVRNGYSIKDITEKLSSAGFRNIEASYTYGIPGNISWHLSMKYPVRMLNLSFLFFLILPIYYLLFFPLAIILNFIDLHTTHKRGTGLLVTARK